MTRSLAAGKRVCFAGSGLFRRRRGGAPSGVHPTLSWAQALRGRPWWTGETADAICAGRFKDVFEDTLSILEPAPVPGRGRLKADVQAGGKLRRRTSGGGGLRR